MTERVGVWSVEGAVEEARAASMGEADEVNGSGAGGEAQVLVVRMSDITDGNTFYVHVVGSDDGKHSGDQLKLVMKKMSVVGPDSEPLERLKKGLICAAPFNDGSGVAYYRARIVSASQGKAEVLFIDFGNSAEMPVSDLKALDPDTQRNRPPQAKCCCLAYLKLPEVDHEFGHPAASYLHQLTWDRSLSMQVIVIVAFASPPAPLRSLPPCLGVVTPLDN